MGARPAAPPLSARHEIAERTPVGEVYLNSLLRAQLRLGLTAIAVLLLALGSLPVVFLADPPLARIRIGTVPLPWLLIGVAVYPLLVAGAWWLVRATERAERDFVELVERR